MLIIKNNMETTIQIMGAVLLLVSGILFLKESKKKLWEISKFSLVIYSLGIIAGLIALFCDI